jgi:hypothetical protein
VRHGLKDDYGKFFLAARNTRVDQLYSTSIPDMLLKQMMDESHAARQVLILDCCFGGAFASKLAKGDAADAQERFSRGFFRRRAVADLGLPVLGTRLERRRLRLDDPADRPAGVRHQPGHVCRRCRLVHNVQLGQSVASKAKQPNSTARTCTTATAGAASTSARTESACAGSASSAALASRPPRIVPAAE